MILNNSLHCYNVEDDSTQYPSCYMDAHSNYNRSVVAVCSNKHTQRLTLARHPKIIKITLYDVKMCENKW